MLFLSTPNATKLQKSKMRPKRTAAQMSGGCEDGATPAQRLCDHSNNQQNLNPEPIQPSTEYNLFLSSLCVIPNYEEDMGSLYFTSNGRFICSTHLSEGHRVEPFFHLLANRPISNTCVICNKVVAIIRPPHDCSRCAAVFATKIQELLTNGIIEIPAPSYHFPGSYERN